jgi:exopolysaccharide biosynthesis polyprenyl glycosylphosphotransferase
MKRFELIFGVAKIPVDFLMTVLAFLAAYELRLITDPITGFAKPIDLTVLPTWHEYLIFSVQAAIALVIIFAIGNMYSLRNTSRFTKESKQSFLIGLVWAMAMITYFFFTRTFPFSRLAMIYSWGLTFVFIIFGRALIQGIQMNFLSRGIGQTRTILVGNNNIAGDIINQLKDNPKYKLLGIIGRKKNNNLLKILGPVSKLEEILKRRKIDELIQTANFSEGLDAKILEYCELNHINYRFVPNLLDVRRTNINIETIAGVPIITLKPTPLDGWGKVIKRFLDIVGAFVGLIVLSPIFLLTAIAIKLESRGPILFSKLDDGSPVKRVGQYGQLINYYKFRSMRPKSHNLRYTKLAKANTRTGGPLVKIKNDPRVTRVGRFIRCYSIDELPQLWSVLIGDVSLVGPRAHMPEEVEKYEKHHHFVFNIKPGITGLAQTSGRSGLSFEEEIKLDRYYIENWSILMDTRLIIKTIGVVLKGHKE